MLPAFSSFTGKGLLSAVLIRVIKLTSVDTSCKFLRVVQDSPFFVLATGHRENFSHLRGGAISILTENVLGRQAVEHFVEPGGKGGEEHCLTHVWEGGGEKERSAGCVQLVRQGKGRF